MQEPNVFQIRPGWTAYDVMMAAKLGVAIEVGSTYVLVEKGPILPTDLYIPLSRVSSVNEEETTFIVNVPKDEVGTMGWENPPADGSWEASDATGALAIPRREKRSDAGRGYLDADEASCGTGHARLSYRVEGRSIGIGCGDRRRGGRP